ncbi:uncharacterized protein LOC117649476 isoform X2 [Thrips palmi]|uniref:Uncharacterized protein LOC117649476 isoform X2 n=1 Tax=Thrips palmi TaxID=161013 RepID=A0A6P8ZSJ4_THRPL|nr:uncharacterized protein LOC117649476 isoform X2 [Thrips palmi]
MTILPGPEIGMLLLPSLLKNAPATGLRTHCRTCYCCGCPCDITMEKWGLPTGVTVRIFYVSLDLCCSSRRFILGQPTGVEVEQQERAAVMLLFRTFSLWPSRQQVAEQEDEDFALLMKRISTAACRRERIN